MRLFFLLLPLLAFPSLAVPPHCDESDFVPGDHIGTCTSLTIDQDVTITPTPGQSRIFFTGISGDVTISANITINGGNGQSDVIALNGGGGASGPGASDGGGNGFGGPEPGNIAGTPLPPDGNIGTNQPCAIGGGGAGFATDGSKGRTCSSTTINNHGLAATSAEFAFTNADFRGGFGGGCGGNGTSNHAGAGGGGGGALHIEATGTITIASGVTISAKGGNGGHDTTNGGGGGAGSGGAVWLISSTRIINNGTIDVRGGIGGKNNVTGAHGGDGRSGRYRLESAGVVTEGTGISSPTSSRPKLTSDISCGTLAKKNDENFHFLSTISAFLLVTLIFRFVKTLYRFPKKI